MFVGAAVVVCFFRGKSQGRKRHCSRRVRSGAVEVRIPSKVPRRYLPFCMAALAFICAARRFEYLHNRAIQVHSRPLGLQVSRAKGHKHKRIAEGVADLSPGRLSPASWKCAACTSGTPGLCRYCPCRRHSCRHTRPPPQVAHRRADLPPKPFFGYFRAALSQNQVYLVITLKAGGKA